MLRFLLNEPLDNAREQRETMVSSGAARPKSQESVTLVDGQRHRKDARHSKGQQIHQQRDKDNPDRRTRRRRGVFRLRHNPFGSGVGEWRPAAASFYAGVIRVV